MDLKRLALVVALIGSLVGGLWAVDARIDARVQSEIEPVKIDVRAIRNLLETYLLQQVKGP